MNHDPVEDLLRRDADAWQAPSPPPLDVALDVAVRRRRPPALGWLAAAAAVAVVASVATVLGIRAGNSSSAPAAGLPSDSSLPTQSGQYVLRQAKNFGLMGAVLDATNPDVVDLLVQQNPGTYHNPCGGLLDPRARVIAQRADSVVVEVTGLGYLPRPNNRRYVSFSCAASGAPLSSLPVRLDAPLGSRTLRAGALPLEVLPATAPVPAYVPPGFAVLVRDHPDPPHGLVAATTYEDMRRFGPVNLTVREGPSDELVGDTVSRGSATIHNRHGNFTGGTHGEPLCLTWLSERYQTGLGEIDRQVCVDPPNAFGNARHVLVRVARSLPTTP